MRRSRAVEGPLKGGGVFLRVAQPATYQQSDTTLL